ncbi:hypothetical protein [Nitratiruptor sp. SB155-2]|uniref:hypothetical protein n=1 Tax=Nitratiruptor sp. (strain SB155-2) TaxID=387092 RepID=UPI0001587082|nr:hypothetical protein [Nitratiruptor sp. SB155-2]BAF70847.1 conserved hypothetical protein [Nitratiruptor sp. SB155-2]
MQFFIPNHCPKCQGEGKKIKFENLLCNLKDIASLDRGKTYYFCKNRECEVVYFSGLEIFTNSDLFRKTAYKSTEKDATICFCFGYKVEDADQKHFEEYLIKKSNFCACSIRNPSGKCCKKLFETFLELPS